jgi:hypothetical protein
LIFFWAYWYSLLGTPGPKTWVDYQADLLLFKVESAGQTYEELEALLLAFLSTRYDDGI